MNIQIREEDNLGKIMAEKGDFEELSKFFILLHQKGKSKNSIK